MAFGHAGFFVLLALSLFLPARHHNDGFGKIEFGYGR
jgi:hypothetical protein